MQRKKFKDQYDKSHLSPLSISVGDRVYLRDFVPKLGLSQKLVNPWCGQFRVIEIDRPHLTIVSISSPQSKPKRVHMNQVKRCYELSGPACTSPWEPETEQLALAADDATDVEMIGYSHTISETPVITDDNQPSTHQYNTRFRHRRTSV